MDVFVFGMHSKTKVTTPHTFLDEYSCLTIFLSIPPFHKLLDQSLYTSMSKRSGFSDGVYIGSLSNLNTIVANMSPLSWGICFQKQKQGISKYMNQPNYDIGYMLTL